MRAYPQSHLGTTPPLCEKIRIVNPVSEHAYTSAGRALRFIRQGKAEWVERGVPVRFIESRYRHALAQQSANATRNWYERAVNAGMARLLDLANLPMVAPASRYTFAATQGV